MYSICDCLQVVKKKTHTHLDEIFVEITCSNNLYIFIFAINFELILNHRQAKNIIKTV